MRGGDLIDRIIENAHYTENDAKEVCKNLLQGVDHCHQRKIANRNLKPENLLLVVSLVSVPTGAPRRLSANPFFSC
jgi:serine/threonine protein kinase